MMSNIYLAHIGINADCEQDALRIAEAFSAILGVPVKAGNSSVFVGGVVEVMKVRSRGKKGHIGLSVPSIEAACKYFEGNGHRFDTESAKYDNEGRMTAIYFQEEISGFAIHLLRRQEGSLK